MIRNTPGLKYVYVLHSQTYTVSDIAEQSVTKFTLLSPHIPGLDELMAVLYGIKEKCLVELRGGPRCHCAGANISKTHTLVTLNGFEWRYHHNRSCKIWLFFCTQVIDTVTAQHCFCFLLLIKLFQFFKGFYGRKNACLF